MPARHDNAQLSPCGRYRYVLTRELGGDRALVSIGLNPSVADATVNDPTIRRDIGFAKRWGLGRVIKLNASAYIATDPRAMARAAKAGIDVVGPDNDAIIRAIVRRETRRRGLVVVSWGAHILAERQRHTAALLAGVETWCLGVNRDGSPVHELYQPYVRKLMRWRCP